jgi:hypothetical protein
LEFFPKSDEDGLKPCQFHSKQTDKGFSFHAGDVKYMMILSNPLVVAALICALLSIFFLLATIRSLKRKKLFRPAIHFLIALLMICLFALFGTISIAVQGYRTLTAEVPAAVVKIEPTGEKRFTARFFMPDSSQKTFFLAGDQLYVDAHILKWKPVANIFGLHTAYELDRVAGRYTRLTDETTQVHTIYALSEDRPLKMFDLRRRFAVLSFLLDAEYGSATFITADKPETFRIMVSTSGLLIRKERQ